MKTRISLAGGAALAACAGLVTLTSACGPANPSPTPHPGAPVASAPSPSAVTAEAALAWTHITTNMPPLARSSAGFVYDPSRQNIVLSGGRTGCGNGATNFTDTWTLTGTQWQLQPKGASPGEMQSFTAAYDPDTSQVIALGIYSGCGVDTGQMSWDGKRWTAVPFSDAEATLPHPMRSRGLAYDAAIHRLIAVGPTQPPNSQLTMETWAYDGTTWKQLSPATSPPPLEGMSVAYDSASRQVVLFGGAPPPAEPQSAPGTNETWVFDGSSWTQLATSSAPANRVDAAMVYDDALGKLVLFGGASIMPEFSGPQPQVFDDMWTFDGTSWQQLHPAVVPPGRFDAQMTYDAGAKQIVLFGGALSTTSDSNDTWTFGAH